MPFGVLVVELASDGQEGCRACAYGVCGLRAARGWRVACGVVLGCEFCVAVRCIRHKHIKCVIS